MSPGCDPMHPGLHPGLQAYAPRTACLCTQVRGCIPAVLSDPISFPFEMLFDYSQMTIKLPEQCAPCVETQAPPSTTRHHQAPPSPTKPQPTRHRQAPPRQGPSMARPRERQAGSTNARACPKLPHAPARLGHSASCAALARLHRTCSPTNRWAPKLAGELQSLSANASAMHALQERDTRLSLNGTLGRCTTQIRSSPLHALHEPPPCPTHTRSLVLPIS